MIQKNIKLNMLLNSLKGILSVLFPLITFPYVSKILQVDNIGKYNFANSVVSYFLLLASLGIPTYAVREGAKYRETKEKFNKFANEVFSINIYTTILSYCLLFLCILAVPKLHNYKALLIILSLQLIFKTVGIEWIYSIYEDYFYITVRSVAFQILSLIAMFMFVHKEGDYYIYAGITVLSSVGSNIFNFIHSKKYCNVRFTKDIDWNKHLKPIIIFFATSISITIYVSASTTILGFLCSEYHVGVYSVAVKIYNIVKQVISSAIIVSIPRFAYFAGQIKDNRHAQIELDCTAREVYNTIISLVLPALVGIMLLADNVVLIIADASYAEAAGALRLLSVALVFCVVGYFWGQCVLYTFGEEKVVLKATIISAAISVGLNLMLIPVWKHNAAAFTTIVAEAFTALFFSIKGHKYMTIKGIAGTLFKVCVGCCGIIATVFLVRQFNLTDTVYTCISIGASVVVYLGVEIFMKNEVIISLIAGVVKKIRRRRLLRAFFCL